MRKYLIAIALIAVAAGVWLNGQKLQKLVDGQAAPVTAQDPTNAELEQFAQIILGGGPAVPQPAGDDGGISLESAREVLTIGTPNAGRGDTLYDAANKIQANFYELFNAVYTNAPASLTYTNMVVSDGTDSVTAAEIIDSTDDAVLLRTLSGTATGAADLGTFTGDIIADSSTVKSGMQALETDVDALQTLSGVADAATNLGTFTGDIITDGSATVKSAIQELETDLDAVQTLSGVADAATNLGTFTGSTIPDSRNVKTALQDLETKVEAVDLADFHRDGSVAATGNFNLGGFQITNVGNVDGRDVSVLGTTLDEAVTDITEMRTLSGTADEATTLGTFTGTTIPDNTTIKNAVQQLETAHEGFSSRQGDIGVTYWKQTGALGTQNLRDLPFHGYAQSYTSEVGMKFNAVSIPRLVRSGAATELWKYIIVEVRAFPTGEVVSGLTGNPVEIPELVATGRVYVDPNDSQIDDVFVQLYNPLGGPITIDDTLIPSGDEFLIGYYAMNDKGPAALGDARATTDNHSGQSFYYADGVMVAYTGDPIVCVDQIYVPWYDSGAQIYNGAMTSETVHVPVLFGRDSGILYTKSLFGEKFATYRELKTTLTNDEKYLNRIDVTATAASGTAYYLTSQILDEYSTPVGVHSMNISIVATNTNSGSKTILCIGDSLTSGGVYLEDMNTIAAATGDSLTFVGTVGSDPTKNEGRGGYTIDRYWDPGTTYYTANPFTENDGDNFNFSFYLTDTGVTQPDAVVIALGTNDIFNLYTDSEVVSKARTNLGYLDQMITSIHAVSSSIRVFIATVPPGGGWGAFPYVTSHAQTPERWRRNVLVWNRELYRKFGRREADLIHIAPIHLNLDPDNHFSDGVHLTTTGYEKMAEGLMASIKRNW